MSGAREKRLVNNREIVMEVHGQRDNFYLNGFVVC